MIEQNILKLLYRGNCR